MTPSPQNVTELSGVGAMAISKPKRSSSKSSTTAKVLDVSERTVKRDWNVAKAWLQRELSRGGQAEAPRDMTPEQWHRVKEVFEAALDHAPEERSAFVGQACAGDDLLHSEVNSLLSSYDQETSFMETPAAALAAQSLVKEERVALIGQQLGHYQIIRELGRGGMGVVYLQPELSNDKLKFVGHWVTHATL